MQTSDLVGGFVAVILGILTLAARRSIAEKMSRWYRETAANPERIERMWLCAGVAYALLWVLILFYARFRTPGGQLWAGAMALGGILIAVFHRGIARRTIESYLWYANRPELLRGMVLAAGAVMMIGGAYVFLRSFTGP